MMNIIIIVVVVVVVIIMIYVINIIIIIIDTTLKYNTEGVHESEIGHYTALFGELMEMGGLE